MKEIERFYVYYVTITSALRVFHSLSVPVLRSSGLQLSGGLDLARKNDLLFQQSKRRGSCVRGGHDRRSHGETSSETIPRVIGD